MALIMHRCTKCNHPDYWARVNVSDRAGQPCPCGCTCTPGKPKIAPTWDIACKPVERIADPGIKLAGEGATKGGFAIVTCGCDACKALHTELTIIGPGPKPPLPRGRGPRELRKWAAENGIECPQRGRIPQQVIKAYNAVHA
jgi:hypothetical protein